MVGGDIFTSKFETPMKITNDGRLLDMKMSDLIHLNYHILLVLQRLNIGLGFKEMSVAEVCRNHGVAPEFFSMLVRLQLEERVVVATPIRRDYFSHLLLFLKNSHDFFIREKLPYINTLIGRYSSAMEHEAQGLLENFWSEYANEVKSHMEYEDSIVFPLIYSIYEQVEGTRVDTQLIHQFEVTHEDIAEALFDLKNLLIKYFPKTQNEALRNHIIVELFELEADLQNHQQVENLILLPMVMQYSLELQKV